jgi:hypothetical protein
MQRPLSYVLLFQNPQLVGTPSRASLTNFSFDLNTGRVATLHPTSISPNHALIAIYVAAIWIGQIGYCFLIVVARKPETKVGPFSLLCELPTHYRSCVHPLCRKRLSKVLALPSCSQIGLWLYGLWLGYVFVTSMPLACQELAAISGPSMVHFCRRCSGTSSRVPPLFHDRIDKLSSAHNLSPA